MKNTLLNSNHSTRKNPGLMCMFIMPLLLFIGLGISYAQVSIFPTPPNAQISTVFQLSSNGQTIPVYKYMDYHYAHFSLSGTADFIVTASESIGSSKISPLSLEIPGAISGNQLSFPLSQIATIDETPLYLVIQINDLEKLVILADKPEVGAPTSSGSGIYNVTTAPYNADNTGETYAQPAIQQAIDDASAAGGGTVYVPAGIYEIKENLAVKSNVTLYLAPGAVLKAIDIRSEYAMESVIAPAVIVPNGAQNVTIRGRGEIDASGFTLMNPPRGFTQQSVSHPRRRIIQVDHTQNVTFDGIIIKDASGWSMDLRSSDNVVCQNIKVLNHKDYSRKIENDGIDMTSSSNSKVNQCFVITIDDAMCAKARYEDMDNVEFSNNVVYTSAAGVKAGMQSVGNMSNIVFRNNDVVFCYRGIGVDTKEGYLPIVGVVFKDIRVEYSDDYCIDFMSAQADIRDIDIINCNCHTDNRIRFYGGGGDVTNVRMQGLVLQGNEINSSADADAYAVVGAGANDTYSFSSFSSVSVTGVSIVPSAASVVVGTIYQLSSKVLPANATNRSVTWSSSDETVAMVNNTGKVTGLKVGTATITATTVDGGLTASSAISVNNVVLPTSIDIAPGSTSILVGLTEQLNETVFPTDATDQLVTWSSSDPAIATVNAFGVVTGIATGTAIITATTVNHISVSSFVTIVNIPSLATLEAENAAIHNGTINSGASGQFVDLNADGSLTWSNVSIPTSGTYALAFNVSSYGGTRSMGVYVNGTKTGVIAHSSDTYEDAIITVPFDQGNNTIELRDSEGTQELNVDYVKIIPLLSNYEAENAVINNGAISNGATGQYVDLEAGGSITWTIPAIIAASHNLVFNLGVPFASTRSMGVYVNGAKVGVITSSFVGFAKVSIDATLNQGNNTIELRDSEGTQELNVDYVKVTPNVPQYEAEHAVINNGTINTGATGQYVDLNAGGSLTWSNVSIATAGTYVLAFNVGVYSTSTRSMGVYVNGTKTGVITSSIIGYSEESISVPLIQGNNTIELRDSEGTAELNVDYLKVIKIVPKYEAENAVINNGTINNGATGQYVDLEAGGNITWTVPVIESASYTLAFNVGVPTASTRSMGVYVNGTKIGVISSSLIGFAEESISASLAQGDNTIELRDSEGTAELNVDYLRILTPESALFSLASESDQSDSTLKSFQSDPTRIAASLDDDSFCIYPNPVDNGMLNIEFYREKYNALNIFTSMGKLVYSTQINGENSHRIYVGNILKTGLYIVSLSSNSTVSTKILIVR